MALQVVPLLFLRPDPQQNAQESWSGPQLCAPGGPSAAEVLPYTLTYFLGLSHGATTKSQQFKETRGKGGPAPRPLRNLRHLWCLWHAQL